MNHDLIDSNDSIFIVVDVQDNFTAKVEASEKQKLLERVCWLAEVATWLGIPRIITVEDIDLAKGPSAELQQVFTDSVPVFNKMIFGLADQAEIMNEIERSGRKTAVLVGLETDVCIAQSAIGLMSHGYRVAVVTDATASPGESHAAGLRRMENAGVILVDTKMLFYEWVRTVEHSRQFERECPQAKVPTGLIL